MTGVAHRAGSSSKDRHLCSGCNSKINVSMAEVEKCVSSLQSSKSPIMFHFVQARCGKVLSKFPGEIDLGLRFPEKFPSWKWKVSTQVPTGSLIFSSCFKKKSVNFWRDISLRRVVRFIPRGLRAAHRGPLRHSSQVQNDVTTPKSKVTSRADNESPDKSASSRPFQRSTAILRRVICRA